MWRMIHHETPWAGNPLPRSERQSHTKSPESIAFGNSDPAPRTPDLVNVVEREEFRESE